MLKVELMTMFYLFLFIKQWIFSRLPLNKNSNQMFSIIGVKILDKFYLVFFEVCNKNKRDKTLVKSTSSKLLSFI